MHSVIVAAEELRDALPKPDFSASEDEDEDDSEGTPWEQADWIIEIALEGLDVDLDAIAERINAAAAEATTTLDDNADNATPPTLH